MLERYGDDAMRAAIARAVASGTLTVAAVGRALSNLGAQRAQPRGQDLQLALPVVRAQAKDGAS